jgi:glutaryl-CoA dehydrogenase
MPSHTDARFNWRDPLLLEHQLTHDERMVRATARAYCQEKLAPRVLEAFRSERSDAAAIYRELGELDMLAVTMPEQYGGTGLGLRQLRPHRAGD